MVLDEPFAQHTAQPSRSIDYRLRRGGASKAQLTSCQLVTLKTTQSFLFGGLKQ